MPKVSIVVPLYNKGRYIRRAIDSILNQTIDDLEIIVVNDGSTDDGMDSMQSYTDPRLRLIEQENFGVSAARNRGVAESSADLIAFLDADDEWLPFFLETVLRLQDNFPDAGLFATNFVLSVDGVIPTGCRLNQDNHDDGGIMNDYFKRMTYALPTFNSSSVMIQKDVLKSIGGFPVGLESGEDIYTWSHIALKHKIAWTGRICAVYHQHDNWGIRGMRDDLPYASLLEDAGMSKENPMNPDHGYCCEFLNRKRLLLAARHIRKNNIAIAKELIRKTGHTRMFKHYRTCLLILTMMPRFPRNLIYACNRLLTRLLKGYTFHGLH